MASFGERTPGGGDVIRHQPIDRPFVPAPGDSTLIEAVTAHIERHIGDVDLVYHEMVSDLIHLDVHVIPPSAQHPYYTLVTSGMSEWPMHVPEGFEGWRYAELLLCLPPDWPLRHEDLQDEANYWPIRCLKTLARLPHKYRTWLAPSHTVPNGDPAEPYAANTAFCCTLVDWPLLLDEGVRRLEIGPERVVNFYSLVPLYREEMDYKLQHGIQALAERLDAIGVTERLDIGRANACRD